MHYASRFLKLSSIVCLEQCTTENSSPRWIMRLVPVFILETNNQTSKKCLPKFVQTDNASSSIKMAIDFALVLHLCSFMIGLKNSTFLIIAIK